MERERWERQGTEWLRGMGQTVRADGFFGSESGSLWFGVCVTRGVVVLVPVMLLVSACFAWDHVLGLALMIFVSFAFFGFLIALLPAFTGALVYLPVVWWAARRSPRAGRVIAIACAPLMWVGTLPYWKMWRAVEMWQVWIPVALGLLAWSATLPLPAREGAVSTSTSSRTRERPWIA